MRLADIREKLRNLADADRAKTMQRFFKTGPGEYAEGDLFLGIRVPMVRKLAKEYRELAYSSILSLLTSPIHEERQVALFILVYKYQRAGNEGKEKIYNLYLDNTRFVNNWDLVDATAEHIVGAFLMHREKTPLYRLAKSGLLWERRIAVMSTFHFIKHNEFSETLKISSMLVNEREDLIHKAVGWMLREVGKRDIETEELFLRKHYRKMPRTMLRYAIERFPETKRKAYLLGKI